MMIAFSIEKLAVSTLLVLGLILCCVQAQAQEERPGVLVDPLSSNNGGRWSEIKNVLWFEEGAYHLHCKGCVSSYQLMNGVVEIQGQQIAGSPDVAYGLAVRANYSRINNAMSGYALYMRGDGSWQFARIDANVTTALVPWTFSTLLHTGDNASNTLAILCNGEHFTILLNNHMAAQISDGIYNIKGEVGPISTSKDAEIVYRNLKLTPLLPGPVGFDPKSSSVTAAARAEIQRLEAIDGLKLQWAGLVQQMQQQKEKFASEASKLGWAQADIANAEKSVEADEKTGQSIQDSMLQTQAQVGQYQTPAQSQAANAGFGLLKLLSDINTTSDQNKAEKAQEEAAQLKEQTQETVKSLRDLKTKIDGVTSQITSLDRRNPFPKQPLVGKMIISQFGNWGPCYAPGLTPLLLGWGGNDIAYPDRFVVNYADGAEMVWIPSGAFTMGASAQDIVELTNAQRQYDHSSSVSSYTISQPAHHVEISQGCWLYRYKVTAGQYRRLHAEHAGAQTEPVVAVSWTQAQDYATTVGGALPSEAVWEYACRAGEAGIFWWGSEYQSAPAYANLLLHAADPKRSIEPVGSHPANGFGLFDMAGDAGEWCADWFDGGYYKDSPAQDPQGPLTGTARVIRGSTYLDIAAQGNSFVRHYSDPEIAYDSLGFRVCVIP